MGIRKKEKRWEKMEKFLLAFGELFNISNCLKKKNFLKKFFLKKKKKKKKDSFSSFSVSSKGKPKESQRQVKSQE